MSEDRDRDRVEGGCIAFPTFTITHSSSFSKSHHSISSLSDYANCSTPVWRGKGLTCVCFKRKGNNDRICTNLTPQQVEKLRRLRHRTKVHFDASRPDHQDGLRALWCATYPGQELQSLVSDQWKQMGWQGKDPSTDFRGAGFISLENLLFFAKTFPTSFQSLLRKKTGKRAVWEYPFAVAGVNLIFRQKSKVEVRLKHLGFVKILAINAAVVVSNLYDYAKQHSGPLKSTVGKVEHAVTPAYSKFNQLPTRFSRQQDVTFDERAPPAAKSVVSKTRSILKKASDLAEEAKVEGPVAAISHAGKTLKDFTVTLLVMVSYKANQYSLLHRVLEVAIPTATHLSEKYNSLVKGLVAKAWCSLFSYVPLVPVEEMEKAYKLVRRPWIQATVDPCRTRKNSLWM